jgi:hypothetical protein
MRITLLTFGMFLLLAINSFAQYNMSSRFNSVKIIERNKMTDLPSFVIFEEKTVLINDLNEWIRENYRTDEQIQFELIGTETDNIGYKHFKYNQSAGGTRYYKKYQKYK